MTACARGLADWQGCVPESGQIPRAFSNAFQGELLTCASLDHAPPNLLL